MAGQILRNIFNVHDQETGELVGYVNPVTGRAEPFEGAVSVRYFGAKGDGVTDDTAAIQAALNTGRDVFVPGTDAFYLLTAELTMQSNQRIYGEGARSQLRQTTALANVISATSKTGCVVENLGIYCGGDSSNYITGNGVIFKDSNNCSARGNHIQNHRGFGVNIYASNDCQVFANRFENSTVEAYSTDTFADVGVIYSSSRNVVTANYCNSGQATGVLVQTINSDDNTDGNVVSGNTIRNTKAYGIVAYRVGTLPDGTVRGTVISGNTIDTVYGSILNGAASNYSFGAGIYIQGAEESVVTGNTIRNTHADSTRTFTETLAPGAIGVGSTSRVTVTNNVIEDCGMFGIHIGDGSDVGELIGDAVISGNVISNVTRVGINVLNQGRMKICNNAIDTCAAGGIRVANTVDYPYLTITGNTMRNTNGIGSIEVNYASKSLISDNLCDVNTTHGIHVANTADAQVSNNVVAGFVSRGIQITSTCARVSVKLNKVKGTGSSAVGLMYESVVDDGENEVSGCTLTYGGAASLWRTLTANSTTPSVSLGRRFLTANTNPTTITNFTGGVDGQEITVVFGDANTTLDFTASSLKGNGGVDRAMGAVDAIHAVYRAAASAWYVTVIDA